MPKKKEVREFTVVAVVTISIHTKVRARTEKEAIATAREQPMIDLCHQCSSGCADREWCTSGELDGEPSDLRVEP